MKRLRAAAEQGTKAGDKTQETQTIGGDSAVNMKPLRKPGVLEKNTSRTLSYSKIQQNCATAFICPCELEVPAQCRKQKHFAKFNPSHKQKSDVLGSESHSVPFPFFI
uniref:PPUP8492 n=1 Tax=Poeciliopsis prolifica TaxID=188132 RepID=A0A0S7EQU8_9TELE